MTDYYGQRAKPDAPIRAVYRTHEIGGASVAQTLLAGEWFTACEKGSLISRSAAQLSSLAANGLLQLLTPFPWQGLHTEVAGVLPAKVRIFLMIKPEDMSRFAMWRYWGETSDVEMRIGSSTDFAWNGLPPYTQVASGEVITVQSGTPPLPSVIDFEAASFTGEARHGAAKKWLVHAMHGGTARRATWAWLDIEASIFVGRYPLDWLVPMQEQARGLIDSQQRVVARERFLMTEREKKLLDGDTLNLSNADFSSAIQARLKAHRKST